MARLKHVCLSIGLCFLFSVSSVFADDSNNKLNFDDFSRPYALLMGATFNKTESNGLTTLNITINQDQLIQKVPDLQKEGVLNPDITQTSINETPYTIATFVLQFISVISLDYMFEQTDTKNLRVNEYLDVADDYGNSQHRLAISFDFNKNIAKKINWDNFKQTNLAKIAPNFKVQPWLLEKLSDEMPQ